MKNDRQGAQGILNEASNAHLENEFGTSVEEEIVKKILHSGSPQVGTVSHISEKFCTRLRTLNTDYSLLQASERQGDTNITGGSTVAH